MKRKFRIPHCEIYGYARDREYYGCNKSNGVCVIEDDDE